MGIKSERTLKVEAQTDKELYGYIVVDHYTVPVFLDKDTHSNQLKKLNKIGAHCYYEENTPKKTSFRGRKRADINRNVVLQMKNDKVSITEIAKHFGVNRDTIYQVLKESD